MNPTDESALADELVRKTEEDGYELVDGELVEKPMGSESSLVAMALGSLLRPYLRAHNLGRVYGPDCGYQIFPKEPKKVRKPDISIIAAGRVTHRLPRGNLNIVPDLVGEVISPNDLAEDIDKRISEYVEVGVRVILMIYPVTTSVWVLRQDGSAVRLTASQELTLDDVVPGFRCPVQELFADL